MNKAVSAALLAIGIILLFWGLSEADSFGSQVSEFFTGSPTDRAMWLMIGGVASSVIGLVGLVMAGGRAK